MKTNRATPAAPRLLDQADRPQDVRLDELEQVPLAAAEPAAGMLERRVHDGIAPLDQFPGRLGVAQAPLDPVIAPSGAFEAAEIARRPIPAAAVVPLGDQVRDDVSAQEPGGAGHSDTHRGASGVAVGEAHETLAMTRVRSSAAGRPAVKASQASRTACIRPEATRWQFSRASSSRSRPNIRPAGFVASVMPSV